MRRLRVLLAATLAATGASLLLGTAAVAAPLAAGSGATAVERIAETTPTTTAAEACTVSDAQLVWGFKESFRSYISGTIANGTWETSGGATYATPDFSWTGGTGTFDTSTQAGDVHFAGAVHFTGHDGLLDSTVANPTLSFAGDGTARLLLDLSSVSMESALAGSADRTELTQVPFVSLDLASAPLQMGNGTTTVTGTAIPTAITAEGFDAFGSYDVGTAFDPLTFTLTLACPEPEPTPEPTVTTLTEGDALDADATAAPADTSWVVWIVVVGAVVGVALVVLVVWMLVRARRRGRTADGGDRDDRS